LDIYYNNFFSDLQGFFSGICNTSDTGGRQRCRTLFELSNGRLFFSHTIRHGCTLDFENFLNIFQMAARCLLPTIKQHNRLNTCKLHVVPKGTLDCFYNVSL